MNGISEQAAVIIFATEKSEKCKPVVLQIPTADIFLKQFEMGLGLPPSLPPKYFLIKGKWILMTAKQLMTKYEDCKKNNTTMGEISHEESLFEQIVLQGTHLKTLTKMKQIDYQSSCYITYCGFSNRFYVLNMNNPNRLVSSAPDLSLQRCNDLAPTKSSTLSCFVQQTLKTLINSNKSRWRMPWRWNNWEHLY